MIARSILFFLAGFMTLCVLGVFLYGCASISLTSDTEDFLISSSSRALGYKAALQYPEYRTSAITACNLLLTSRDLDRDIKAVVEVVLKTYEIDPLIIATLRDLMGQVKIEGGEYEIDMVKAKIVIKAFQEGLILGEGTAV